MKLGTENKKKVWALVVFGGIAIYSVYSTFSGPSQTSSSSATTAAKTPASLPAPPPDDNTATAQPAGGPPRAPNASRSDEFKPVLRSKRKDLRVEVTGIDPTLRLDLLAKLEKVPAASGQHNLFQTGTPPPVQTLAVLGPNETKIKPPMGPQRLRPADPPPPPPQRVPVPINVKYYGWAAPSGTERRRAFFLDGDDILVKFEGEPIKGHYRVVRIGPSTVIIEDTNDKLQQTLTKVEEGA